MYVRELDGDKRYVFLPWDYDLALQHPFSFFTPDPHWTVLPEQSGANCQAERSSGKGSFYTYSCDAPGYLITRGVCMMVVVCVRGEW